MWAVLMTALTYVFGGVPLKALRSRDGRGIYWLISLLITGLLLIMRVRGLGIAFFSLVILIGFFSELEDLGFGFLLSSFLALLMNTLIGAGAFALWVSATGPKWSGMVQSSLEMLLKPLTEINHAIQIDYSELMMQLPSIVIILWMGSLYLAVLMERRLKGASGRMRAQLGELRLPDPVVWIFILALLGAFGGFEFRGVHSVSLNALNVCFVLFFFQGIAVVSRFFSRIQMGSFWQAVFMALIVIHLFLFVSLLGLVDYWLDFRTRMSKGTPEYKREI
ncbi:MAG: DUF2232 domain-containing protein [Bdellovibrionales bacterium]